MTPATPWQALDLDGIRERCADTAGCWALVPRRAGGYSAAERRRASRCRARVRQLTGRSGEWACGVSVCVRPEHVGSAPRWGGMDLDGIREHCTVLPRSGCWLLDAEPEGWDAAGPTWSRAQRQRSQRLRRRVRALIGRPEAIWRCGVPCVCPEHATLSKEEDAMRHATWRLFE